MKKKTSKNNFQKFLLNAKNVKKDDFYTQLTDIEKELKIYRKHFKNKIVYCNCDDPRISNFFHYFSYNFEKLGLKKLITACYKNQDVDLFSQNQSEKAIYLEYTGDKNGNKIPDLNEIGVKNLKGDGDFRSEECIGLLKQADIVVTNPPFSLFREYVDQLIEYKKKFLIMGNINAVTFKQTSQHVVNGKIWLGHSIKSGDREFQVHDSYQLSSKSQRVENGKKYVRVVGIRWFTNLDYKERHEPLDLFKKYNKNEYPKLDNYDAININKTKDIPENYKKLMAVPITFIDKYNPSQFELLGITDRSNSSGLRTKKYTIKDTPNYNDLNARGVLKIGKKYKALYPRLLIKKKS